MVNNKGFTLIELIVTISLLAAVSIVVGMNVVNMLSEQQDNQYKEFKTKLENAACVYAEKDANCRNRNCNVTIKTLIDNGLIERDLVNPNKEKNKNQLPVTSFPTKIIKVTWSNNEKKCIYEE